MDEEESEIPSPHLWTEGEDRRQKRNETEREERKRPRTGPACIDCRNTRASASLSDPPFHPELPGRVRHSSHGRECGPRGGLYACEGQVVCLGFPSPLCRFLGPQQEGGRRVPPQTVDQLGVGPAVTLQASGSRSSLFGSPRESLKRHVAGSRGEGAGDGQLSSVLSADLTEHLVTLVDFQSRRSLCRGVHQVPWSEDHVSASVLLVTRQIGRTNGILTSQLLPHDVIPCEKISDPVSWGLGLSDKNGRQEDQLIHFRPQAGRSSVGRSEMVNVRRLPSVRALGGCKDHSTAPSDGLLDLPKIPHVCREELDLPRVQVGC
mmetsp:Transcript_53720/g.105053  ORF Transcript_53720/g.105053 Transcript_53720/m.105053 type:complete len:320 (-) Transcript_53720:556-1515(-)